MADKEEVVEQEEDQSIQEDQHEDDHESAEPGDESSDDGEDERLSETQDEQAASEGETDEEAEARRQRNRQMREERKTRRKEKEESYKRELAARDRLINEQSERLAALERRSQGADMAALDKAIADSANAYNYFKQQHALAVEQANGVAATDATEKMLASRQRYEQLNNVKVQATQRKQQPQPLDKRLVENAQSWMTKNKWYDPGGQDPDSSVALTIDDRLHREGFDPRTPEYWQELDVRLKKYLPHRYTSGYNKPQGQNHRPPVAGSGRESAPSGNKSTYKLSSARVQALKDLGAWDDPKAREEHIKNFREYDKVNGLI